MSNTLTREPTIERVPSPPERGTGLWLVGFVIATVAILTVPIVALGAIALITDDGSETSVVAAPTVAEIGLREFAIEGDLTVPAGPVTLRVTNNGSTIHNLVATELSARTPDLTSGGVFELDLGTLEPGTYELLCDIPGHTEAGMRTTLTVVAGEVDAAATGEGDAAAAGDHTGDDVDFEALDDAMTQSILAFPAETEGRGNTPLEPTLLDDGTVEFEITAAIVPWEVEPGKFVDAWTYNGQVPGPEIRVDVGDQVRVIVHNELPMGTDVHWHGIDTPNDQDGVAPITQDLIRSGETFTYEFVADEPAIGMYHAHHHAQTQVPNGMFGAFIIGEAPLPAGQTISGIEIPADLEIAHEMPMVLNDAGVIGFSLNGKSFPATEPVVLEQGDWMVVHYYNEGLIPHPMHLHQFPQLIYAKDGIPLDVPYWADTINVAPGERYSVLINTTDPGTWVWHCHILTHVERAEGMFGMVTALVVT